MIYRGEKLKKLGWCATSGTRCIIWNGSLEITNCKQTHKYIRPQVNLAKWD